MLWVAVEAILAPLPPHWREADTVPDPTSGAGPAAEPRFLGDVRFVNVLTGEERGEHPLLGAFRGFVQQRRSFRSNAPRRFAEYDSKSRVAPARAARLMGPSAHKRLPAPPVVRSRFPSPLARRLDAVQRWRGGLLLPRLLDRRAARPAAEPAAEGAHDVKQGLAQGERRADDARHAQRRAWRLHPDPDLGRARPPPRERDIAALQADVLARHPPQALPGSSLALRAPHPAHAGYAAIERRAHSPLLRYRLCSACACAPNQQAGEILASASALGVPLNDFEVNLMWLPEFLHACSSFMPAGWSAHDDTDVRTGKASSVSYANSVTQSRHKAHPFGVEARAVVATVRAVAEAKANWQQLRRRASMVTAVIRHRQGR